MLIALPPPQPIAAVPIVNALPNPKASENARCRPYAAKSKSPNLSIIVKNAAGLFFPLTHLIGVEPDSQFSPCLAPKVIHAASASTASFAEASSNLKALAEVDVSAKRIERLVTRIGKERIAEVQQQATEYHDLPIPLRTESPVDVTPELVCVQVDGGRLQVRDRNTEVGAQDDHDGEASATFWRESKVGTLLKMTGATYLHDPCPRIPSIFIDAERVRRLTREIKGFSADGGETAQPMTVEQTANEQPLISDQEHESVRPKPLVRSVVATSQRIAEFSQRLVGQAYQRGFMAAQRKAFVCDGLACNWTLHEKHFSRFTPILDFVHALCYIYHAAIGGRLTDSSWQRYCQWAQLLWSGDCQQLLSLMKERQLEVGLPAEDEKEAGPKSLLADAIRYVTNQQSRMKYASYRRDGLPITSAYIESTIKQVNRRVKGTEKFWSTNADPILQLRADAVSETEPMKKFWKRRAAKLPTSTHYNMAG